MRILQINSCHFRRGGADVMYLNTGDLLSTKGNEVFYFSQQSPKNNSYEFSSFFTKENDFRSVSLSTKLSSATSFIYNDEASSKLKDFLKIAKPDVAHIHLFLGNLSVSILKILNDANIPVIHTVHDYRLICPAYTFLNGKDEVCERCKDGFFARCGMKKCSSEHKYSHSVMLAMEAYFRKYVINPFNFIDHFIFVSDFSRNKHIQFNPSFGNKSSVIYNFSENLENKVYQTKDSYFLYYGRLSREKGVETLISAVAGTDIQLKVVGSGPLRERYRNTSSGNIHFEGFKEGNELWHLVQNASFIVVPSEWYENNPMTIVESFSFGKPVIGANIGGIPELIHHGKNGYIFESRDPLSLLNVIKVASEITSQEYAHLSSSAYKFALENFNKEAYYESLINIYKNIIAAKNN